MPGRTSGTRPKGSGIPAGGAGWGGQAKGAGHQGAGPGRPEGMKDGEGKRAKLAELCAPHTRSVLALWLTVLRDKEAPAMARIAAADKIADRAEGKAVATTVTAAVDQFAAMSDADLEAAVDRARRALAGGGDGAGEEEG